MKGKSWKCYYCAEAVTSPTATEQKGSKAASPVPSETRSSKPESTAIVANGSRSPLKQAINLEQDSKPSLTQMDVLSPKDMVDYLRFVDRVVAISP